MAKTTEAAKSATADVSLGTGRRKTSVARVRIRPGKGQISINKRSLEEYCTREQDRVLVLTPLQLTGAIRKFDLLVNVRGGGISGQAGAIRHGVARALAHADESYFQPLKDAGMLTRDARQVERKKPGKAGARASFQFSKR